MSMIIGVLALQGAFEEHISCLQKLGCATRQIKTIQDLEDIDGIICPGGESTAMAIVGEKGGLFPALNKWVKDGRPIWGTCAGMILLSDHAIKQASGGQSLVGGLDVHVCRNYFGSQVYSCEFDIDSEEGSVIAGGSGIFIRAPAILVCGSRVKVLGTVNAAPHPSALHAVQGLLQATCVGPAPLPAAESAPVESYATANSAFEPVAKRPHAGTETVDSVSSGVGFVASLQERTSLKNGSAAVVGDAPTREPENIYRVAVAVQQGNILATAFHPELSDDLRWHRFFLNMVAECKNV